MRVVIIDCGAGNLHSVRKAVAAVLPDGAQLTISTRADEVAAATHIILPGVGAFADCMQGLLALDGMREVLERKALRENTPFLGICVGMQMLFEYGHEHGSHAGLGWFKGAVKPLVPSDATLKIPHMGWNRLCLWQTHPILQGIHTDDFVYFVHSYAAQQTSAEDVLATVEYGGDTVAMIGRGNIVATQFHPEKSQQVGLQLLTNFLAL